MSGIAVDGYMTPSKGLPEPRAAQQHCAYCGALLSPGRYFCTVCATPYKDIESVLPALYVPTPTDGQRVAKAAPHVYTVFWTYLGVCITVGVLGYLLLEVERPGIVLFFQTAALFVTTFIFAVLHWPSLLVQFKRLGFTRPVWLLALFAMVPLLTVNYYYHGWLMEEFGGPASSPLEHFRNEGVGEVTLVVLFCVFPGVLEEIAFRGLVQHWLHAALSPLKAMALASALFTALHFSVSSAPYLFTVGMLLGWTRWKTGSLYPSMFLHFLHNFIVLEYLFRSV